MSMKPTKVVFLRVKENTSKLQFIYSKVHETVKLNKRIIIFVPNEEAAKYIDSLLWRMPEESLLPHAVVHGPSKEWVAITLTQQNVNQAHRMLNLCPASSPLYQQFEEVYEIYDETQPQKRELSQKKLEEYQAKKAWVVTEA